MFLPTHAFAEHHVDLATYILGLLRFSLCSPMLPQPWIFIPTDALWEHGVNDDDDEDHDDDGDGDDDDDDDDGDGDDDVEADAMLLAITSARVRIANISRGG